MQILLLVIGAYLFLPVIGELFLLTTGNAVVAGDVTWELFTHNLIYSSIVYGIIIFFYIFGVRKYKKIGFVATNKDHRTLKRIAIFITIFALLVFYFSGYAYLFQGINRGEIRVSLGALGFLYKWITIYAVPLLLFITTLLVLTNKSLSRGLITYIYCVGAMSTIFTGYKYVIIFSFIPVIMLLLFNKNIIKSVMLVTPIALLVLTLTTKMVMGYGYEEAFYFLIHRMTVMTAFGTIGLWNHYADGAPFMESIKLSYSLFGSNVGKILFGIDPNSIEMLDTNLSRKITYMVYPSWEKALSGTTNVTVTNFGEAVYIFGKEFYWLYAIFCGLMFGSVLTLIIKNLHKGKIIATSLFLIYCLAVLLSWLNSTTVFSLISFPVFVYLVMTYVFLLLLLKARV